MTILFQGTVTYHEQDIAFTIAEIEQKQLQISISFIRGANTNKAEFDFNKKNENHWELDRKKTKSDINLDLKYDNENGKWIFGTDNLLGVGNVELVLKKKQKGLDDIFSDNYSLTIEKSGVEIDDLTKIKCIDDKDVETVENKTETEHEVEDNNVVNDDSNVEDKAVIITENDSKIKLDIDLDKTIKGMEENGGLIGKFFTLPMVKGLCNDLERTIEEKVALQNKTENKGKGISTSQSILRK